MFSGAEVQYSTLKLKLVSGKSAVNHIVKQEKT